MNILRFNATCNYIRPQSLSIPLQKILFLLKKHNKGN